MNGNSYWQRYWRRRLSRRGLLRGTALGAAGLAAAAVVGCGEEEEGPAATPTPAATTPAAATPTPAAATPTPAATPAATPTATPVTPVRGGILREAATGSPPTLDPDRTNTTHTKRVAVRVYSLLFRQVGVPAAAGLGKFPITEFEGDVAESMPEITDDGLTYIVKLRPNVKFQPPLSRPLDSEDVVFSVRRALGQIEGTDAAVYAPFYDHIEKVENPDPLTVVFKLNRPHALFVSRFASEYNMLVLPKEIGTAFDPTKTAVGSGRFILKSWTKDVEEVYVRNPEWHLGPDQPYLDGNDIAVIPEYATRLTQFLAGNIDGLATTAADLKDITSRMPDATVYGSITGYLMGIVFQMREKDAPWQDQRVRQAFSLALDRDALFDALYSPKDVEAAGLEPPKLMWHSAIPVAYGQYWLDPKTDPKLKPYFEYNPQKAKQLLADAGYPDGFTVSYHYTKGYGPVQALGAELIIPMLTDIGIKLDVKVEDFRSVFYPKTFRGDFDGLAYNYHGQSEPGDVVEQCYASWGSRNYGLIEDPWIDDIARKIQAELDFEKRRQMIYDFQYYAAEKMYFVPSQHDAGPTWTAWAPRVRDAEKYLTIRGEGGARYHNIWIAA